MSTETRSGPDWRNLVANGLFYSGSLRMLQGLSRRYEMRATPDGRIPRWGRVANAKFVILCYHRVAPKGFPFIATVAPEAFEAQMRYLSSRYHLLSMDELWQAMGDPAFTGQGVAITFDDGYRDLYTHALPTLKKYKIPAMVYLTAGSIETGQVAWYDKVILAVQICSEPSLAVELDGRRVFDLTSPAARLRAAAEIMLALRRLPDERRRAFCDALERRIPLPADMLAGRMLTWEQVREMQSAGIEFGSHTVSHPVISRLSRNQVEHELLESRHLLEMRLERNVKDFAFPFGRPADCGLEAEVIIRQCGYRSAATTSLGSNAPGGNPYSLLRVQIGEDCTLAMFAFRLSLFFLSTAENCRKQHTRSSAAGQDAADRLQGTTS